MEAKNLRIGNFIKDRGNKVIRIDFMEYQESGYSTKFGQRMFLGEEEVHPMTEYTDYAIPIEITDEWLEMFGANCIGAKGWNFISVNKADTSYIYFNPNGIGLAIDNGTTENAIEVEIKYVHQLQNLYFALTNTELTIKTK